MTIENYNEAGDWWTIGNKYAFRADSEGPRKIRWHYCGGMYSSVKKPPHPDALGAEISVFTEKDIASPLVDMVKSKYKIAWMHECRSIHPWAYNLILQVEDKFDYIFTFDDKLLEKGGKYVPGPPPASSCILEENISLHPKSKFMSMVVSTKGKDIVITHEARGHFLRHIIAEHLRKKNYDIDLWGSAYKSFPLGDKISTLKDYHFQIVIVNGSHKNYFTDVLTDCFRTGTVPIFWGCENVGNYFNEKGIIRFENPKDFNNIIKSLSTQDYYDRMEYIEDNFQRVRQYFCTDDHFVDKLIEQGVMREDGSIK
jgi:hypothetical protein